MMIMMMRSPCRLLVVSIATAIFSASAASDVDSSVCSLCQDGSTILDPTVLIEETGQTCAELQEEASWYSDPISCRYYHRYGNSCGCKNIPPKDSFCELCQDSSPIPDPSLWLDGYDDTCGAMAVDAFWNLWHTFDTSDDDNQDNCDYYHHVGSLCGCKTNRPPSTGCNLCLDGKRPTLSKKKVTPGNAGEETCLDYSHLTKYVYQEGTEECSKAQSLVGSYCGCSETPTDSATATISTCDMCPSGLVTKDGWAPDIDLVDGKDRIFYFRDAACIKIAMLASEFDFPCNDVPSEFVDECCEPAADGLAPEVFTRGNPKLNQGINWDEFIFLSSSATSTRTTTYHSVRCWLALGMCFLIGLHVMI